jgi:beta-phosphoglucomutase-like phosphatase (HAD superfamily)
MKAIVFDVDGVIIISAKQKNQAIKKVLQKHELFDVPGVAEILAMSLNRKVLLQKISLLHSFDTQIVLADINAELGKLENKPEPIPQVIDFIKKNHKKYLLFTNTSLPRTSLERILSSLDLSHCFEKLFSGDDGFKKDNINLIIQEY